MISAITTDTSFQSKQHNYRRHQRPVMTDEQMQMLALRSASSKAEKRRRRSKRFILATPLIAAMSTAILHRGSTKALTKEFSGLASKAIEGLKSGGTWALGLGIGALVVKANSLVEEKSEKYGYFRRNNPVLSFIGDMAAYSGIFIGALAGGNKIYSKIKPEHISKMGESAEKIAGYINSIKKPEIFNKISKKIIEKIPASIKNLKSKTPTNVADVLNFSKELTIEFGKGILAFAPWLSMLSSYFTSVHNTDNFVADYADAYAKLRQRNEC